MRVTGGEHKGRVLKAGTDQSIRPTTDKVRLAIFNMLFSVTELDGACAVDLFCGAGSLGIEFLSRSTDSVCTFIDNNPKSLSLIKDNISALRLMDRSIILRDDCTCLARLSHDLRNKPFDIVFMDPPYMKGYAQKAMDALHLQKLVSRDAVFVIETEVSDFVLPDYLHCLVHKTYGKTQIRICRHSV